MPTNTSDVHVLEVTLVLCWWLMIFFLAVKNLNFPLITPITPPPPPLHTHLLCIYMYFLLSIYPNIGLYRNIIRETHLNDPCLLSLILAMLLFSWLDCFVTTFLALHPCAHCFTLCKSKVTAPQIFISKKFNSKNKKVKKEQEKNNTGV